MTRGADLLMREHPDYPGYVIEHTQASRIETLKRIIGTMPQQCAGTSAALTLIALELEEIKRSGSDGNRDVLGVSLQEGSVR